MSASGSQSPTGDATRGQSTGNPNSDSGSISRVTDNGSARHGGAGTVSSANETLGQGPRASEDGRPRVVRFSEDGGALDTGNPDNRTGQMANSQSLTLDTGVADSTRHATTSPRSPEGSQATSPTSGSPTGAMQSAPRGRNRGMSLRSSMFARNFQRTQDADDTIIEMGEVASPGTDNRATTQSVKGKNDAAVTVSSIIGSPSLSPETSHLDSLKQGIDGTISRQRRPWYKPHVSQYIPVRQIEDTLERARKFVLRIKDMPPSKDGRHIPLDPSRGNPLTDERTQKPHINNTIRSSKYNAWNFLPRQLFAQFSKLANFYFLCVSILQMIPGLSTTGTYTTIVPLLFFVSLSMAKEGLEDFRRYKLDREENNRLASVLHAYGPADASETKETRTDSIAVEEGLKQWVPVKWHNLRVGDVVKLQRDEAIPADIVLLHSSGPNDIACIETMALDGETNLKNKQPSPSTSKLCGTPEGIMTCGAHFVVEDPNLDLYNFEGRVTVNGKTSPLTNNEIVYRGSVLRNTPEAIGMIINSGEECKIRMNANKNPRIKAPTLQSTVNKIIIMMVVFVVGLSLSCSGAYEAWSSYEDGAWYLVDASVPFGPIFTSFVIMFNTLIPLSLYVSLEIVKVAQMLLLNDIDMYDEESNTPSTLR